MRWASRILIVGKDKLSPLEVGADFLKDLGMARERLKTQAYDVICLTASSANFSEVTDLAEENKKHVPNFWLAIIDEGLSKEQIIKLTEGYKLGHISEPEGKSINDSLFIKMLERIQSEKQRQSLYQLINEQKESLIQEESKLNNEFAENQKKLLQTKDRLNRNKKRINALKQALVVVHNAGSITDIESLLVKELSAIINLSSVKIAFQDEIDVIEKDTKLSNQQKIFSEELFLTLSFQRVKVFFFREDKINFKRDEISFLNQVSDIITLAVDRLLKIQRSKILKHQWELTFDAISDGLCLCTEDFKILRTNKSFIISVKKESKDVLGKNVFEAFYNIEKPQKFDCNHPHSYSAEISINRTVKFYELTIHPIDSGKLCLIVFHDVTEQKRLEKQLLENSKMLELGSISGSLAHEINNPLGGVISFLQLIKMNMKKTASFYNDVIEMEVAANRCKAIVENLLGFSRKHQVEAQKTIDLKEIVDKAIEIQNLKARYKATQIENLLKSNTYFVQGNKNLLVQVVMNLLQNSLEAIAEQETAKITIMGIEKDGCVELIIEDNGPGILEENLSKILNPLFTTKIGAQNNGLGLTVAFMILSEHKAQLEIRSKVHQGGSGQDYLWKSRFIIQRTSF